MGQRITRGELVVIAAGVLALVASFLPFYKNSQSVSSWDELLFPLATLIPILAVLAALLIVATKLQNVGDSRRVLGFGFAQLALVLSFEAAALAWAFFVAKRGGFSFGIGYFLLLLASIASLGGSWLVVSERLAPSGMTVPQRHRRRPRISLGEILIVVAAIVALVASILPFYKVESFTVSTDFTLWSTEFVFLFPVATLILVYAIASAFVVAVTRLGATEPADVASLRPSQFSLAFSAGATVLALTYLIQDEGQVTFGLELGVGYYLLLAACVGSTVGAVLLQLAGTRAEAV